MPTIQQTQTEVKYTHTSFGYMHIDWTGSPTSELSILRIVSNIIVFKWEGSALIQIRFMEELFNCIGEPFSSPL